MRRDIRRRVFCPVISPAWRRRIGSGPLAAAVGRQREPLALVHEFRSGVVLDDLGAFDRCPATLRVGGVQISGPRSARTGGAGSPTKSSLFLEEKPHFALSFSAFEPFKRSSDSHFHAAARVRRRCSPISATKDGAAFSRGERFGNRASAYGRPRSGTGQNDHQRNEECRLNR